MRGVVAVVSLTLSAIGIVAAGTMQLSSTDFTAGGVIPLRAMAVECGGQNRSPQLEWSNAPKAAKSFALIVHDPDAPLPGGFYHWVVYNLTPADHGIATNAKFAGDQIGATSAGTDGYYGPCPPPGPVHHYIFTLYALDLAHIATDTPLTGPQLQRRIAGHVIAHTALTGLASRH